MTIREKIYQHERESLSKYAMLSENTIGREYPIEESDIRTEFMRDRDRITHSKAFRRLRTRLRSSSILREAITGPDSPILLKLHSLPRPFPDALR